MKTLVLIAATILLCSCADYGPPMRTSVNLNGQSMGSMNLADPKFYMDDDKPASGNATPPLAIPHYGIDGYCGPACRQGGGGWSGY
jgi:hypothetical protein